MRTKHLYLLIYALFCFTSLTAQTYYYKNTKTFYENGYTYQCDVKVDAVTLYNKSNKYTYAEWRLKNGQQLPLEIFEGEVQLIKDDNWTKKLCKAIVNNAFTPAQAKRVLGRKFDVMMTVDTSTGKVIEVQFWFLNDGPYSTIPISVYREIETKLKSQIYFELTDAGKTLNFVKIGWMHEVEEPDMQVMFPTPYTMDVAGLLIDDLYTDSEVRAHLGNHPLMMSTWDDGEVIGREYRYGTEDCYDTFRFGFEQDQFTMFSLRTPTYALFGGRIRVGDPISKFDELDGGLMMLRTDFENKDKRSFFYYPAGYETEGFLAVKMDENGIITSMWAEPPI